MDAPPLLPRKRRRHLLPWIIGGSFALLLLCLGGVAAFVLISDDPPVDDSFMRPEWHSDEERLDNPLAEFLDFLEEHPMEKDERFALAGSKTSWDQVAAESLLAEYGQHLKAADRLLATDAETWLWPSGPAMAYYESPSDEPSAIQYLGNLLTVRSKAAAQPDIAITHAEEAMRFGVALAGAEGTAIHLLIAVTSYAQARDALKAAVTRVEAGSGDLAHALAILQRQAIATGDLAFTLKVEHETFANALEGLPSGRMVTLPPGTNKTALRGLIKVQRGLRRSVELNQPLVLKLSAGWPGAPEALAARSAYLARRKSNSWRYLSDGIGGILLNVAASSTEAIVSLALDTESQRRLAITQIALRQYELANGRLPASLTELDLPADEILDPWSQAPLIWNRDSALLYSVGRNGKDDGGSFNTAKPRDGADRGGPLLVGSASQARNPLTFPHHAFTTFHNPFCGPPAFLLWASAGQLRRKS